LRSQRFSSHLLGGALALALTGVTSGAAAQQAGMALDRFDPAPAGDRMFGVQSPFVAGELTPHLMLLADYAHNPLVLRRIDTGANVGSIVSNQLFMHLNAGIALWNRLNLNIDVPVAAFQDGGSPNVGGQSFASPSKAELGDLRLGARVRLWGEYFDPFQIAVGGYVWAPTGPSTSYVGDGKVRGMPQLIVGGRTDRLVWSGAIGPEIRGTSSIGAINLGSMLKWGAGVGFLLGDDRHLQLGVETNGGITFRDIQKRTTNAEILGDVRYRVVNDVEIGAAFGPGLAAGVGTPAYRGLLMIAYTPEPTRDRDGDGIWDVDDACPDVPGVHSDDPAKNGCPIPPDRDHDGIYDADDACPDVPGVRDPDPKKNGCPPDRDGDGILDAEDACPDVKGVRTNDPATNGCPPDRDHDGVLDDEDACPDVAGIRTADPRTNGCPPRFDSDGDGIYDDEDACPYEKGARNADPKKNGCPKAVRVTETEILILEQVQFDFGKATIKKVSDDLLDEVAGVLLQHPEILVVEVQGHTDDRGSAQLNYRLSDARADAVRKALIKRSIEASRLQSKGYGKNKPIATNETDDGRQINRRVQFVIVEKKARAPRSQP
jgi:outer membrane protein OmpA-like peptidoglycan-associated protein